MHKAILVIKNINKYEDLFFSQNLLLNLINKGMSRQNAYELIQSNSKIVFNSSKKFKDVIKNDPIINKHFTKNEINNLFLGYKMKYINKIFKKAFK